MWLAGDCMEQVREQVIREHPPGAARSDGRSRVRRQVLDANRDHPQRQLAATLRVEPPPIPVVDLMEP